MKGCPHKANDWLIDFDQKCGRKLARNQKRNLVGEKSSTKPLIFTSVCVRALCLSPRRLPRRWLCYLSACWIAENASRLLHNTVFPSGQGRLNGSVWPRRFPFLRGKWSERNPGQWYLLVPSSLSSHFFSSRSPLLTGLRCLFVHVKEQRCVASLTLIFLRHRCIQNFSKFCKELLHFLTTSESCFCFFYSIFCHFALILTIFTTPAVISSYWKPCGETIKMSTSVGRSSKFCFWWNDFKNNNNDDNLFYWNAPLRTLKIIIHRVILWFWYRFQNSTFWWQFFKPNRTTTNPNKNTKLFIFHCDHDSNRGFLRTYSCPQYICGTNVAWSWSTLIRWSQKLVRIFSSSL